jgi:flagellin
MTANKNLSRTTDALTRSLERLSSGFRINRAGDDAAGLAISQKFRAEIASLKKATQNTTEAFSLLQVAEGGMEQIHAMLTRLKELATQAASANSSSNLAELDAERSKLVAEINRIALSTDYSGTNLLNGFGVKSFDAAVRAIENIYDFKVDGATNGGYTVAYVTTTDTLTITKNGVSQSKTLATNSTIEFSTLNISFKITSGASDLDAIGASLAASTLSITGTAQTFQIGDDNSVNEQISFQISTLETSALGTANTAISSIDITTQSNAQVALGVIDAAIDDVNRQRGAVGANMNRLQYAQANLQTAVENLTASESVIRDVDMAQEMSNFTKSQILQQAGAAMLAQANALPQVVLQLLQ